MWCKSLPWTGQPPATDATDATERLGLGQWVDRIETPRRPNRVGGGGRDDDYEEEGKKKEVKRRRWGEQAERLVCPGQGPLVSLLWNSSIQNSGGSSNSSQVPQQHPTLGTSIGERLSESAWWTEQLHQNCASNCHRLIDAFGKKKETRERIRVSSSLLRHSLFRLFPLPRPTIP